MCVDIYPFFFFFNATAPTEIYTLSLHDALPIYWKQAYIDVLLAGSWRFRGCGRRRRRDMGRRLRPNERLQDRKSTRLNSSHITISYAVFCLKKKNSSVFPACEPRTNWHSSSKSI